MLQCGIVIATACTPLLLSKLPSLPLAVNLTVSVVIPVAADAAFDGAFDINETVPSIAITRGKSFPYSL